MKATKLCTGTKIPFRYIMALMMSFIMILGNGFRSGFALVMTHITSNRSANAEGLLFPLCTTLNSSRDLTIDMSVSTVFYLHATYLLGTFICRLPAGIIATCLSPSKTLGIATLLFSLVTMAIPLAIQSSVFLLFVARLFAGSLEGFHQPISDGLVAVWSSSRDLSRLTVLTYSGCYIGAIISFFLAGSCLCYISWDSIFYIYSLAGVVWCIVWFCFAHDSPDLHPGMSSDERLLLEHGSGLKKSSTQMLRSVPWRNILSSRPVWALLIANFGRSAVFSMLNNVQAQYFHDVYGMNSADIGLLAALPYLVMIVGSFLGAILSDHLINKGLSVTTTRKLVYSIGVGADGACLVGLAAVNDWGVALFLLNFGSTMGAVGISSMLPLPMDMSPQYSKIISGLITISMLGGIAGMLFASRISSGSTVLEDWQIFFLALGMMYISTALVFVLMASAVRQPWDDDVSEYTILYDRDKDTQTNCDVQLTK